MDASTLLAGPYFHMGMVVDSLEAAMRDLRFSLGQTFAEPSTYHVPVAFPSGVRTVDLRYTYSRSGPPYIELMQTVPDSPWSPNGVCSHHIGYWVDDLTIAARQLQDNGFSMIAADAAAEAPRSFVMMVADHSPLVVELVPGSRRHGLERWTGEDRGGLNSPTSC